MLALLLLSLLWRCLMLLLSMLWHCLLFNANAVTVMLRRAGGLVLCTSHCAALRRFDADRVTDRDRERA